MKSKFSTEIRNDGRVIFDGLYGRGHGKEVTIQRFQAVLGLSLSDSNDLFDRFVADDANLTGGKS